MPFSMPTQDYFHYLPVCNRDRQWNLYVSGAGRVLDKTSDFFDFCRHPAPYRYTWETGRVLSEYSVLYITRGRGEFQSEASGAKVVAAGNVVLLFPGVWHRYRPAEETGWDEYWVALGGGYVKHLVKEGFISPQEPVLATGLHEVILHPFLHILDRVQSEPLGYRQLIAANTMEILGATLGAVRAQQGAQDPGEPVRQAQRILEARTEELVDIEELAASLSVGYGHFRHAFKQQTGMSPYQYHLQLRLNRAKEMLRGTDLSITEIAAALKFEDPYHFSKIFKKHAGVSPSQWRRNAPRVTPA